MSAGESPRASTRIRRSRLMSPGSPPSAIPRETSSDPASPLQLIFRSPSGSSPLSSPRPMEHSSPLASSPGVLLLPPVSPRRRRSSSVTESSMDSHFSSPPQKSASGLPTRQAIRPEARARSRDAQKVNDSMVYLDGPQVYACAQCRTHLTSHDDIISKSFHGRHGRAYLFDQCVNVRNGPSQERWLMTGMHQVCDIFCKRCDSMVGWTYLKAFEASQKYKEGKYIIEKINLHLEESDYYDVAPPAGERSDRWRKRAMSWGSESSGPPNSTGGNNHLVYEYGSPSGSSSERQL